MASRWASFQRGLRLILNWKSCSGSEIFLIWSLSVMKYLRSWIDRVRKEVLGAKDEHFALKAAGIVSVCSALGI